MMREYQIRQFRKQRHNERGFTLMEIVVATAIFVTVVSSILVLFNYVLQINRRVQAVRQVAQGARNFTEVLSREIRNGRIDYSSDFNVNCMSSNYTQSNNQSLVIVSHDGRRTCLYLDTQSGILYLQRVQGEVTPPEAINPSNFTINPATFRFIVRPTEFNPPAINHGVQPMVTILAEFEIYKGQRDEQIIPYQTTISSDVYDIPHM